MVFAVVSEFLVVLAAAVMAVLLFWSWPGRPKPYLNESGHPLVDAVSEKVRADINGFEQGMFLRGNDKAKPVPFTFRPHRVEITWPQRPGAAPRAECHLAPRSYGVIQPVRQLLGYG
jgi:hypothetical protein